MQQSAPARLPAEPPMPPQAADAPMPDVLARMHAYAALLQRWTRRINLVSAADQDAIWTRHVLDSLRLLPHVPPGTDRAIDLGSGAGLPGLVLAIATGIPFALVDSDRRKAAFLAEAQRVTAAPVSIHCTRIESAGLAPAPLVTARALAPLSALLPLAAPLLAPGGTLLLLKGARAAQELAEARAGWHMRAGLTEDPAHPGSAVLALTEVRRA